MSLIKKQTLQFLGIVWIPVLLSGIWAVIYVPNWAQTVEIGWRPIIGEFQADSKSLTFSLNGNVEDVNFYRIGIVNSKSSDYWRNNQVYIVKKKDLYFVETTKNKKGGEK